MLECLEGSCFYSINLLPLSKIIVPPGKITSMHNCKLGRGTATSGGKGQLSTREQRSGTRREVTPVAQHWSGRETGWEEAGAGPGESTHPSHRALGTAAHRQTLQLLTVAATAASPLTSPRKMGTQSCKHNKKKQNQQLLPLSLSFVWTNLKKKRDLRKTAGRCCQTLAETGACCLHFCRREKQVKGSERTARCDLARRTNQVNFQPHDTGKRRRKKKKSYY